MPVEIEVTYSLEIAGKKVFFPDEQTACIVRNALNALDKAVAEDNVLRFPEMRFTVDINGVGTPGPHAAFLFEDDAREFIEACCSKVSGGTFADRRKGEASDAGGL